MKCLLFRVKTAVPSRLEQSFWEHHRMPPVSQSENIPHVLRKMGDPDIKGHDLQLTLTSALTWNLNLRLGGSVVFGGGMIWWSSLLRSLSKLLGISELSKIRHFRRLRKVTAVFPVKKMLNGVMPDYTAQRY